MLDNAILLQDCPNCKRRINLTGRDLRRRPPKRFLDAIPLLTAENWIESWQKWKPNCGQSPSRRTSNCAFSEC